MYSHIILYCTVNGLLIFNPFLCSGFPPRMIIELSKEEKGRLRWAGFFNPFDYIFSSCKIIIYVDIG